MKSLARNVAINSLALSVLPSLLKGFTITGGLATLLVSGFILSIMSIFLKPILQVVTLPLNLITFGAFSFIINAVLLYLLTILVPQISIKSLEFSGLFFMGFVIPKIVFNQFFGYVAASLVFSFLVGFIGWLVKK